MLDSRKSQLAAILGVRLVVCHDRYLGLPATSGRSWGALFWGIRDRIWDIISGWNSKLLSQAGKSVLVKAVLQSLPTYILSCFQVPGYLVRHTESTTADFGWHCRGEKRIHWVAWQKLCKPTLQGGIGFCGLNEFNLALLAKQGWRILSRREALLSKVLKA
ncbi:UNVERIFIED_CONTAM: hypothetical protein Sradi_6645400 [Sesamum radiatum]|uniref:Uncharacterized protein n=1 Tax=Sesamum radiatum TaxID=300843 RepID=A0AAW2JNY9_SESRA